MNVKTAWFKSQRRLLSRFLFYVHKTGNLAFVFKIDCLVAGFTVRYVLHINKRLKLDVRLWLERMEIKFVSSIETFAANLDKIVIVTILASFKLNIQLNR